MGAPKAIASGTLLDGVMDCYVLDDERRVVSQRGLIRVLTGGTESGNLGRYIGGLPKRFAHLQAGQKIEFRSPTGPAIGLDSSFLVDICNAYLDAFMAGELKPQQAHLAVNARRIAAAFAKVGVIALIDEATGYQAMRDAAALSFAFRAILRDEACDWDLMFPEDFVSDLCRLHGHRYDGGPHPQWLASTYEKIYVLILGDEVAHELKRRNPEPKFGTNHHQWLTPEARNVVRSNIPVTQLLAKQSGSKDEFWARMESHFQEKPLQLSFTVPKRNPPQAPEDRRDA